MWAKFLRSRATASDPWNTRLKLAAHLACRDRVAATRPFQLSCNVRTLTVAGVMVYAWMRGRNGTAAPIAATVFALPALSVQRGQCAEPVQANPESSCVAADSTLDLCLSRVAQPVARLLDRWIRAQHAGTTPAGGTPLGNWPPIRITASLPRRKPDVAIFFDIFPNSVVTS
jgi:hypothetical protein